MNKIKGVSFTIENSELHLLDEMPDYYTLIRLRSLEGQTKSNIHYPLKYPPANYNSWQQFGRVVYLIGRKFKTAKFEEVEATGSYVYTLHEFASHFKKFTRVPKPYYPQEKSDFMRHLTFYAQRLHFKGMLNIGYLNAMAIKFNVFIGSPFTYKECLKKAWSIFLLDRSDWKVQVGKPSNKESSLKRKQLKADKISIIASHLEQFTKKNGKVNASSLSSHLGIPKQTLSRLLPEAKAHNNKSCDHITKPNGTNIAQTPAVPQSDNRKKLHCITKPNGTKKEKAK